MAIFFHITEFYINNTIKLYIIKHHTIVMLNNSNHIQGQQCNVTTCFFPTFTGRKQQWNNRICNPP
eukprot:5369368-Ditylum_brightwellii.AAC.1